ncbi:MAG: hypothetical protein A3C02_00720 [Candidatus Andersenbacteria bacterium RIFCSPHIGHO2_02_FULL_45_11]|uniref:Uncharacterized protein n=1 Tax=Candidatus Andersenbacteria bacterium RIFCSPHIGHO2_12_FULL_45_11 TaxID=1797281 RepID=A0A1G1X3S6_9BACT|nr:MAG: hypothetical protein A2805_01710 [Candidatus Andersenbacteria bacterium RIFCSPHIGHO2_01_FULL_46_36]OGY33307.1 MAG: hypothetical protein A3C02_00720 [Candidatus Andersenbacteria bacterium RIFCSPHIGHO2_02_FULL_45_11]OGY34662.1 MAG: hypothetical protein A3D99_04970 [Candidatus Andersenbacteria bacterium RIFCSPHIGHO2_12_FULL_45_11]
MVKIKRLAYVMPGPEVTLGDRLAGCQLSTVDSRIIQGEIPLTAAPGFRKVQLACFGKKVLSKVVERYAGEHGLEIGLLDDLLIVAQSAEYQNAFFPVYALGSCVPSGPGRWKIPCLSREAQGTDLRLEPFETEFLENAYFVLVQK